MTFNHGVRSSTLRWSTKALPTGSAFFNKINGFDLANSLHRAFKAFPSGEGGPLAVDEEIIILQVYP